MNSLFLDTLQQRPSNRRPVWLMRQAGRYLPEYRRVRAAAGDFLTMVHNPAIVCEITLQPLERFALDAAIIFSDILLIPEALGMELTFVDGEGPRFTAPLQDEQSLKRLAPTLSDNYMRHLHDTCQQTRRGLAADIPLIGFCGAPFTLACYMIDGSGGAFWRTRALRRARPDLLHRILAHTSEAVTRSLIEQVNGGCQAIMLFDSWGGLLDDAHYEEFSLRYIRRIIAATAAATDAPIIVFARQCALSLPAIAASGCAAVGVDWQTSLPKARQLAGDGVALQGNLDPAVLLADTQTVIAETTKTLESYGGGNGHIFNLGHGIDKHTPPENVAALVETVHNYRL